VKWNFLFFAFGLILVSCAAAPTVPNSSGVSAVAPSAALKNPTDTPEQQIFPSPLPFPAGSPLPSAPPRLDPDFRNGIPFPAADTARLVLRAPDGSLRLVDLPGRVDPGLAWSAGGLSRSFGNTANGFVFELRPEYLAVIGASGEAAIPFFPSAYMEGLEYVKTHPDNLVVLPGDTPPAAELAWSVYGWDNVYARFAQELFIVSPDGSRHSTLIAETSPGDFPYIEPLRWSRDGRKLYYDRVPDGTGGWIPFGGATGLYEFDLQQGTSREWIRPDRMTIFCIGDLSRDERLTADNCNEGYELEIRELHSGQITRIPPPADFSGAGEIGLGKPIEAGGARFSPQSGKVAYGFNRQPGSAQPTLTWLAVANVAARKAQIILTGQPDEILFIVGWLNEDEILLQRDQSAGDGVWTSGFWIIRSDGREQKFVGQGGLVAIL
jgi:hypothetical protein